MNVPRLRPLPFAARLAAAAPALAAPALAPVARRLPVAGPAGWVAAPVRVAGRVGPG
jgi:hypothetical protein